MYRMSMNFESFQAHGMGLELPIPSPSINLSATLMANNLQDLRDSVLRFMQAAETASLIFSNEETSPQTGLCVKIYPRNKISDEPKFGLFQVVVSKEITYDPGNFETITGIRYHPEKGWIYTTTENWHLESELMLVPLDEATTTLVPLDDLITPLDEEG